MQATSLQVIRMITAAVCRNCKGSGGCRSHPYLSHTNIAKSANFVSDYQHTLKSLLSELRLRVDGIADVASGDSRL